MARPKLPLIVRRQALRTALDMIDERGLEGFSVRRLADTLGVTGPALYHHFGSRAGLVTEAARLAVSEAWAEAEQREPGCWRGWLRERAHALRDALARHPAVVPVVVDGRQGEVLAPLLDAWAGRIMSEGAPAEAVAPLLDQLAALAVGSASHGILGPPGGDATVGSGALAAAVHANHRGPRDVFDLALRGILDAIEQSLRSSPPTQLPA